LLQAASTQSTAAVGAEVLVRTPWRQACPWTSFPGWWAMLAARQWVAVVMGPLPVGMSHHMTPAWLHELTLWPFRHVRCQTKVRSGISCGLVWCHLVRFGLVAQLVGQLSSMCSLRRQPNASR
jgi:hypothetical protein